MDIQDRSAARRPQAPLDPKKLPFGRTFAPNMFMMDWDEGKGWHDARIVPYGPLNLAPRRHGVPLRAGDLRRAEGLHAPRRLHPPVPPRPQRGTAQHVGAAHVACPRSRWSCSSRRCDSSSASTTTGCRHRRHSLRPPGHDRHRGGARGPQLESLSSTSSSPARPALTSRTSRSTVRIMVARDWVRAAPGGTGAAKTGGNYAASLVASAVAQEKGCDQVMWLDAVERRHVEEVGAMNLMFVFDGVVTTPPTSGTILAGITRESLGVLCKELKLPFVERYDPRRGGVPGPRAKGDCTEIFGCGTAAVVSRRSASSSTATRSTASATATRVRSRRGCVRRSPRSSSAPRRIPTAG